MIQFKHITRSYNQKPAVIDLTFNLHRGKITGLLGPNGAGKTTTLRLLLEILPPDSGEILIDGKPVNHSISNLVGYVPEERGFYKKEKISHVFKYLSGLRGGDPVISGKRFSEVLERFNLSKIVDRTGNDISKGQAQIAQLAIALSHDPDILVLDEPYSGLDPQNQEILITILTELKERDKYILLSTHLLEKADSHLDDIILLNKGTMLYTGKLEAFMQESSLSVLVEFDGIPDTLPVIPGVEWFSLSESRYKMVSNGTKSLPEIVCLVSAVQPVVSFMKERATLKEKFLELTHSQWE